VVGSCERNNESSGYIKGMNFLLISLSRTLPHESHDWILTTNLTLYEYMIFKSSVRSPPGISIGVLSEQSSLLGFECLTLRGLTFTA
jgi:hypothetical protein